MRLLYSIAKPFFFASILTVAQASFADTGSPETGPSSPEPSAWKLTGTLELKQDEVIGPITFSSSYEWTSGGDYVAASVWDGETEYSAWLWSAGSGLRLVEFKNIFPSLIELKFLPRDVVISSLSHQVFAHTEQELRAWKVSDGSLAARFNLTSGVATNDVAFVADHYLAAKEVGGAELLSRSGEVVVSLDLDGIRPYDDIQVVSDGLVFMRSGAFTLHLDFRDLDPADLDLGDVPGSFGPYEALLDVSPSGNLVATYPEVGDDPKLTAPVPTVRIWEDVLNWNGDTAPFVEITAFDSQILSAAFSSDETRLLTLEQDGDVTVWNTRDGKVEAHIDSQDEDPAVSAAFTPKGDAVVLSQRSGVARLFDLASNRFIQEFPRPSSDIVFSPDGTTMITYGIAEAPARLWRRKN